MSVAALTGPRSLSHPFCEPVCLSASERGRECPGARTVGGAAVAYRPMIVRSSRLSTLPEGLRGKASRKVTALGTL